MNFGDLDIIIQIFKTVWIYNTSFSTEMNTESEASYIHAVTVPNISQQIISLVNDPGLKHAIKYSYIKQQYQERHHSLEVRHK